MCERISWIELADGTLLYLTTYDLWDTKDGKRVREQFCVNDWWGHSAIKLFYKKKLQNKLGTEYECQNFATPENFPAEIAQAIKDGKFQDIAEPCMLAPKARASWTTRNRACAAHDETWTAYDKAWTTRTRAWAAYKKACAAYNKAVAARDKACAARNEACAARNEACAIYDKTCVAHDKACAAYNRARGESSNPFPKFWKLFRVKKNRAKAWR